MYCFKCGEETKDHSKFGVYLCDECYMDDTDFCVNPNCVNQGTRPSLVCERCKKVGYTEGHYFPGYKCKSDKCKN